MTLLPLILGAFLLGFAGSVHCVGMCGPIAMLVPVAPHSEWKRLAGVMLYLTGKSVTYAAMGLCFGLFGAAFHWAGLQQALSIGAGVVLLCLVVLLVAKSSRFHQNAATNYIAKNVVAFLSRSVRNTGPAAPFFMGIINGMLPCGLVYIGLTAAVALGNALHAMLFMLAFGLGTMPLLLSFVLLAKQFGSQFRRRLQQLTPLLLACMALVLILRGLQLNIPFVSPHHLGVSSAAPANAAVCVP
jgi:sulfite exporter TauE/SafE